MNIVWISILIIGLALMLFHSPELAFATIQTGSEKAIALCLKLWSIYSIWLGILNILEATGFDKKLAKWLSPVIDYLIGKTDKETKNQIAINLTSNILGMGNACTPSGIKAMQGLSKGQKHITSAMIMFMILNVTGLDIIPTTVISLRLSHGSLNSSNIIFPTLLSTLSSTISGIILVKICSKIFKDKKSWVHT